MTDAAMPEDELAPKGSKMPLILGLVLALAGGGGGFIAAKMGLIPGVGHSPVAETVPEDMHVPDSLPDVAFLAMEPMIISIGEGSERSHVRFSAQLEVPAAYQSEVEFLLPRIINVLNSYLRALDLKDFEQPAALPKLRGQMLRRVQLVVGDERVNDILVMEFLVN
ncbi:flagellar basal body-associated protein FliL [Primorskyibacter flagellatus]|uniref:Flagellar protein FliL n=1 Tax=Primorskyibacter flagellatus TaxID=1387277 RepID=A0A1W2BXH8_9RHOB|nr:flagellar basal body-associated FliL family protein [Primorskyibacter flagellatus]SMC77629.1 flagellar FliL protein [Primorskyibacter flagellatus]